ncbi:MAG TPA: glycosyltransferase family 4 protein [Candidatus Sulfotelmatobacter sp.]|nr:glycosyltransferase family 4 protein [Candidatus Sulfotelmatobacter sp.]
MKIAIAKPDFGVIGGAEKVLRRMERALEARGHSVTQLTVDAHRTGDAPFGVVTPWQQWSEHPEFFQYMALLQAFDELDATGYDVLISTQPPSFAAQHPRHLSLFFHHHRVFYDLAEVYVASGFVGPELHRRAVELVHSVDDQRLSRVTHFLANSEVTKERLQRFSGMDGNVSVYRTGLGIEGYPTQREHSGGRDLLCVGRVSFTKRTELFVHALKYLPALRGLVIGEGDRMPFVRALDSRLSSGTVDLDSLGERDLWLNRGEVPLADGGPPDGAAGRGNVEFLGTVSDERLRELYSSALCVVAPALQEDYGITAVEAMSFGVPLIVCRDGGGLTALVENGVNGMVVEPSGRAIAAAVEALCNDPDMARRLGVQGRETAREYTWDRGIDEVLAGLDRVAP